MTRAFWCAQLPQWCPLSVVKGGQAANLLIRSMDSPWGLKMFGNTLVRNIATVIYQVSVPTSACRAGLIGVLAVSRSVNSAVMTDCHRYAGPSHARATDPKKHTAACEHDGVPVRVQDQVSCCRCAAACPARAVSPLGGH